jgi:hypothetical protein
MFMVSVASLRGKFGRGKNIVQNEPEGIIESDIVCMTIYDALPIAFPFP